MRSTPRSAHPAEAALAALRMGFASSLAAWPVMAGRALFYALIMLVLSALWDKVAAVRLAGTLATSLPRGGLATYVGVTEWITLSVVAVHLKLEDDIRGGRLEPYLLRPKSYLVLRIAEALGGMLARLLVLGATAAILPAVSGRQGPPAPAWPLVIVLGVLGGTVGVMLYALVGLTAFWIRRVLPPLLVVQKLMFLLGGLFAPISLYPGWLRHLAEATPFGAHLAFAGQMVLTPSVAAFWRGLALEIAWIAVLGAAATLVWRAGLARILRQGT